MASLRKFPGIDGSRSGPSLGERPRFLADLYQHKQPVAAEDWREYAGSRGFSRAIAPSLAFARD